MATQVSFASTSHEAWTCLSKLYANPSSSRILRLKEQLTILQRGSQFVDEYLRNFRTLADELTLVGAPPEMMISSFILLMELV